VALYNVNDSLYYKTSALHLASARLGGLIGGPPPMEIAKAFDRVVAIASYTALHARFLLLVLRVEHEPGKEGPWSIHRSI
jgi:hypothetical protein